MFYRYWRTCLHWMHFGLAWSIIKITNISISDLPKTFMYIATHIKKTFWLCCMHGLVVTWVMQKSFWFCGPGSIPLFVNAYFFFDAYTHTHTLVNTSKPLHLTFDQNITTLLCSMILELLTSEYVWFEHPHCWSLLRFWLF